MNPFRNLIIPILLFVALSYMGAVLFQKLGGNLSGQDALCYAGLFAGIVVFTPIARLRGNSTLTLAVYAGLIVSVPPFLWSAYNLHPGHDQVEFFGLLTPAYGALMGCYFGLLWGRHLRRR